MNLHYMEFRFWSIVLGCRAARISMHDWRHAEYFAIVPQNGTGKENREMRNKALDAISEAIERGDQPGEVNVETEWPTTH